MSTGGSCWTDPLTAIVVGGGIAGLVAARELARAGIEVELLEADAAVGGRARQIEFEGFRFDRGAEFYCSFYHQTRRLIEELGLAGTAVEIKGPGALLVDGKLAPMIAGPFSALATPLLSLKTKLRLSRLSATLFAHLGRLDFGDPAKLAPVDDMSVEQYALEQFGEEFLRYGVKPGLESLTLSPVGRTSRALFLAQTQESVAARFYCLQGGMGRLADALAAGLGVATGVRILALEPDGQGVTLQTTAGPRRARAVVLALCGPAAARLVDHPIVAGAEYAPATKLNLGLDAPIPTRYPGVIPLDEPQVAGLQFLAYKGTGQAPPGRDGLGLVWRGLADDEDALVATALRLLRALPGVTREPRVVCRHVERLPHGVPLFPPGRYRALAAADPVWRGRVVLAGDYLASPSLEGAVRSGRDAARRVQELLG